MSFKFQSKTILSFILLASLFISQKSYAYYLGGTFAVTEPKQGLIKNVYKPGIYYLALSFGENYNENMQLASKLSYRRYTSKVSSLKSHVDLYTLGFGAKEILPGIKNTFHLFLGGMVNLIVIDSAAGGKQTDKVTETATALSFGYELEFGCLIPIGEHSKLKISLIQDHILEKIFGNYNFDNHIYALSWEQSL